MLRFNGIFAVRFKFFLLFVVFLLSLDQLLDQLLDDVITFLTMEISFRGQLFFGENVCPEAAHPSNLNIKRGLLLNRLLSTVFKSSKSYSEVVGLNSAFVFHFADFFFLVIDLDFKIVQFLLHDFHLLLHLPVHAEDLVDIGEAGDEGVSDELLEGETDFVVLVLAVFSGEVEYEVSDYEVLGFGADLLLLLAREVDLPFRIFGVLDVFIPLSLGS